MNKNPNISYVCRKVGIDKSTFYRWQSKYDTFFRRILSAEMWGRENINDVAESVILKAVHAGDMKGSQYWLSHNHPRYVALERIPYLASLNKSLIEELSAPISKTSKFEPLFEYYFICEEVQRDKEARKMVEPLVKVACDGDEELYELFFASYAEWKAEKIRIIKEYIDAGIRPPRPKRRRR